MKKPFKKRTMKERGIADLAKAVRQLQRDVADLKKASWPPIVHATPQEKRMFKRALAEIRAGHMTPAFSNSAEFREYREGKRG
jgi:hypothetical protein